MTLLALSFTILLAGQSNAVNVEPYLPASLHHVTVATSGMRIVSWSVEHHNMWPQTEAALQSGQITAIVWWQGESDKDTPDYLPRLRELMVRMRAAAKNPALPIVLVRVLDLPAFAAIRQAQAQFVAEDAHAVLISTDGFQLRGEAHLTPAGYREVSKRIRRALESVR